MSARSFKRKRHLVLVFDLFHQLHDFDGSKANVIDEVTCFVNRHVPVHQLVDKLLEPDGIILGRSHNLRPGLKGGDYTDNEDAPGKPPNVWAVASYRAGESSQITGLASRLGWPVVVKRLRYNSLAGPMGLARGVSVRGIDAESQAQLAAPWPDVLISAGVKNEPVARWIKAQSGGEARLVFLGRTWAPRPVFDLVVTTPQYRLPEAPNVVQNLMTQHGLTAEMLAGGERAMGRASG